MITNEIEELSALKKQNAELLKLLHDRENDSLVEDVNQINPRHTDLVRIEVTKSKGDFGPKELSDQEIVSFWTNTLGQPVDLVDQYDQHRLPTGFKSISFFKISLLNLTLVLGTGRLIYRLKKFVDLQEIAIDPYFWTNRSNQLETITYTCKVLDFNLLPPAQLGSVVTVSVRHTHAEVPKATIDQWLKLYGTLTTESRLINIFFNSSSPSLILRISFRFETNLLGFKTENYKVDLKLEYHIPEFLPIQGKRARIFYHGIPSFCGKCHKVGHLKVDCRNTPATWLVFSFSLLPFLSYYLVVNPLARFDFIKRLRDSGVHDNLFGSWLETNPVEGPVILENVPQPNATPQPPAVGPEVENLVGYLSQLIALQSASKL